MEIIPGLLLPLWGIIAIITTAAGLVVFILLRILFNARFRRKCIKAFPDIEVRTAFLEKYSPAALASRSSVLEKLASELGPDFIRRFGLGDLWEMQFEKRRTRKNLDRLLRFAPEKGLYHALVTAIQKQSFRKLFESFIENTDDNMVLRRLAVSAAGRDFDGRAAAEILGDRFDDIIELTGDPEGSVRFLAVKLLLHINEDRSERCLWDMFSDAESSIRKAVINEFHPADRERFYCLVKDRLLNDPVFTVRRAARKRIDDDMADLYDIDPGKLEKVQLLHLLEQLHAGSSGDEDTAFRFLVSDDLETRLEAALYLTGEQSLERMFAAADLGDRENWDRSLKLLENAAEVNCCTFLSGINSSSSPGTVMLASVLLKNRGDRSYITDLAERVFMQGFEAEDREMFLRIYRSAVECISTRGNDEALKLYSREMAAAAGDHAKFGILLENTPSRGEEIFVPQLLSFLKKPRNASNELLRAAIRRFPASSYLDELIGILRSGNAYSPETVRETFRILAELEMPCCLQKILENLTVLPPDERKEFAVLLQKYDRETFCTRVSGLLAGCDSAVKAAVVSCLPATGISSFIKDIKNTAADPDPDVRVASVTALAGFGETKTISQMTDMLRDPVERVRTGTAGIIGRYGTPAALKTLEEIIEDPNEVLPVKKAALAGLGSSDRPETIKILVPLLRDPKMGQCATEALSRKTSAEDLRLLVEIFKDAPGELREKMAVVFRMMKDKSEPAIRALLDENISSLRTILAEVLLRTGYIDATVRKLRHKSPEVRKDAASVLARIRNREAFKGMILAARDPDQEVRVEVLRALESLNTEEGKPILAELENDPDRRVRKYTLWAMERLKAKNMETE